MSPQAIVAQIAAWLRQLILFLLLASAALLLLRAVGVALPIRTLGHVELAYIAGVYWLTR